MNEINVSLCRVPTKRAFSGKEVEVIDSIIAEKAETIQRGEIQFFVKLVGANGFAFCPATFKGKIKSKEAFDQSQLFPLYFDGNEATYSAVKARAAEYDLPILFSYDSFSLGSRRKFSVVFMNDAPIADWRGANAIQRALLTIFPEAEGSCEDVLRVYQGGNRLLSFDDTLPEINVDSLFMNMSLFLKKRYGTTNYKRKLEQFSKETNIKLNECKLPDVSVKDTLTEGNREEGFNKTSPFSIMINSRNGEKLSIRRYEMNFSENTSVQIEKEKASAIHRPQRSSMLKSLNSSCPLYHEFESGTRRLSQSELMGLATNLNQVESGTVRFKDILSSKKYFSDKPEKYGDWDFYLFYMKNRAPQPCSSYCPHRSSCPHGANILSTVKPKYHQIEKIAKFDDQLVEVEEAYEDFWQKFHQAVKSEARIWHVIRSQTAIGKTEAILQFLKGTDLKVLIVVPTNILKREVCERANRIGITLTVSPSLHELKDDLPDEVWGEIQTLYDAGKSPMPYLNKRIREDDPECAKLFKKYKDELEKFINADGHAITTHRRLTSMDISGYNLVIIDEDIVFSTIINNRETISIPQIKKIKNKLSPNDSLAIKINKILKKTKEKEYFGLDKVAYAKAYAGIKMAVNISALCSATHFCYRKAEGYESSLKEDSISFVSSIKFQENTKYIMLSATADESICNYCFGKENVRFCNCKEARLAGTLNQYGDRPMSRAYVLEDTSVISRIKKWSGFEHTISFKKYKSLYSGELYFGNCAGCDYLKGENIDVIGTPHQPEWIYKLFAYSLGFDVDADLKPNTTVVHNGFRFRFSTYNDETLRAIQFYIIGSELEQAVGRARLLRCDCTVNLFSNFPLRQAVIKESAYDMN